MAITLYTLKNSDVLGLASQDSSAYNMRPVCVGVRRCLASHHKLSYIFSKDQQPARSQPQAIAVQDRSWTASWDYDHFTN